MPRHVDEATDNADDDDDRTLDVGWIDSRRTASKAMMPARAARRR